MQACKEMCALYVRKVRDMRKHLSLGTSRDRLEDKDLSASSFAGEITLRSSNKGVRK